MNKHINYITQQDFFNSLNATANGNTPYIIIDGFGALSNDVHATPHKGLVAYWLDYDKKKFEQFVIKRLNASNNVPCYVYAVGIDFKKLSKTFFIRCANAQVFWRILTPYGKVLDFFNGSCFFEVYKEQEDKHQEHKRIMTQQVSEEHKARTQGEKAIYKNEVNDLLKAINECADKIGHDKDIKRKERTIYKIGINNKGRIIARAI